MTPTDKADEDAEDVVAFLRRRADTYSRLLAGHASNALMTKITPAHLESARNELHKAADLIASMKAERDEAEQQAQEWQEQATYEVGGGPHLWSVRAQAAEAKLAAAGLDWYSGARSPDSFQPVPSWNELRDQLATALEQCAKVADAVWHEIENHPHNPAIDAGGKRAAQTIAQRIRALLSTREGGDNG